MDFFVNLISAFLQVYQVIGYGVCFFMKKQLKEIAYKYFKRRGIVIGGSDPWDIQVKNEKFYARQAVEASVGFGEAYMDGWFECQDLCEMNYRLYRVKAHQDFNPITKFTNNVMLRSLNLQTRARSIEVAEKHYNLGNDLYGVMLDQNRNYSCGYWREAKNLEEAQIAKMDLIAKKLMLKPGMKVLDIGCGYGSLVKYLSENYGVITVGVNLSSEQVKWAKHSTSHLPNVEIRLCDYRDVDEKFDRIVTVGFFEHVGSKNYKKFFDIVKNCLEDEGIFLLHTIGVSHEDMIITDPWVHKYIFPNGMLPYARDIPKFIEGSFVIEDWHNFGDDYHKTLIAWHKNFNAAWPELRKKGYDEKFYRMWNFYLLMAAGFFKARKFQLWQVVMSKNGLKGGYLAVR